MSLVAIGGMTFDLATPHGCMMATLLVGIAEFERELTAERVRSGLAAAKARGPRCWDAGPGSGRRTASRPGSSPSPRRVAAAA